MSTRSFPGGKGGRCVRLTTLPLSCAVVTKSGNLNFLEPSGSVPACNGTALPFWLFIYHTGFKIFSNILHSSKCRTHKGDNLTILLKIHLNTEFLYLIDKILMFKNGSHNFVNPSNIQGFSFNLIFRF
jgi:hypothetical protein